MWDFEESLQKRKTGLKKSDDDQGLLEKNHQNSFKPDIAPKFSRFISILNDKLAWDQLNNQPEGNSRNSRKLGKNKNQGKKSLISGCSASRKFKEEMGFESKIHPKTIQELFERIFSERFDQF